MRFSAYLAIFCLAASLATTATGGSEVMSMGLAIMSVQFSTAVDLHRRAGRIEKEVRRR